MLLLTLIGGEFTVSCFDRSHEVRSNYHWGEADITVVFPHQGPECQPMKQKQSVLDTNEWLRLKKRNILHLL